jgi:hypothetical protein
MSSWRSPRFRQSIDWLQNNPLKAAIVSVVGALGIPALINTFFQEVFVPALMPLNIITEVSTLNPTSRNSFAVSSTKSISPIELDVGIKNPGKRKIYLLRSVWTAEICKFAPKTATQDQLAARQDFTDDSQFSMDLEEKNNPWQVVFPTTFHGLERKCKFIGMGNLITDNSVSPGEEISTRILIVFPSSVSYYTGGQPEPPDYIRVNTLVPSLTYKPDNLSYRLFYRNLVKAPRSIELWEKRNKGRLSDGYGCRFDSPPGFAPKKDQIVHSRPDSIQVWCKLSPDEASKRGVVLTQSTHETWLTDRK